MAKGFLHSLPLLSAVMAIGIFQTAYSQENWAPKLERPLQGNYRSPNESIKILIPSTVSAQSLQRLSLELDTIDITSVVVRSGNYLEYTPIQALAYGSHELRIIDYRPDGGIEEIAFWRLEIRQSALFREASFAAQFNVNASQRVADKNLAEPVPDEFQAQGSGVLQTNFIGSNWTLDGSMDLLFLNDETLSINERKLDMGQFLFVGNAGPVTAQIGHHAISQASLVMDGFYKRGLSATTAINAINSSATAFAMRTNDIVGFEKGLGVNDEDNRVTGLTWDSVLVDSDSSQLLTSATYLFGRGNQGGVGTAGLASIVEQINEGDGFSVAADASTFNRQLRIRAELAQTQYDFDGMNRGFDAIDDDARSFLVVYSPIPAQNSSNPASWTIGVEALQIGTFYKSLANATLPADKDLQRFFASFAQGPWLFETSIGSEENNLDNNPNLATIETAQWYINSNYNSLQAPQPHSFWSWLGTPSYNLVLSQITLKDKITPVGFLANDSESQNISTTGSFNYNRWNWGLGYAYSEYIDRSNQQIDSETQSISLNANILVNDRLQIGPTFQLQETANNDFNTVSESNLYGLSSSFVLLPERLNGNLSYTISEVTATNDPFFPADQDASYASLELTWNAVLPQPNKPGFDISLSFNSEDLSDRFNPLVNNDTYQIFLNISMTLPVALPGGAQ